VGCLQVWPRRMAGEIRRLGARDEVKLMGRLGEREKIIWKWALLQSRLRQSLAWRAATVLRTCDGSCEDRSVTF
jgi:hypothetical protein